MMDDMTSKDALFALETTFDEDVKTMGQENTMLVIRHINSTPELYNRIRMIDNGRVSQREVCEQWAKDHNDEFGDLFISELDTVDWNRVKEMV